METLRIDIRELISLDIAGRLADAGKETQIREQLLLNIQIHAQSAAITAGRGNVDRFAARERRLRGLIQQSHASASVVHRDHEFSRILEDLVSMFDLRNHLKLVESRIKVLTVRHCRQIE